MGQRQTIDLRWFVVEERDPRSGRWEQCYCLTAPSRGAAEQQHLEGRPDRSFRVLGPFRERPF